MSGIVLDANKVNSYVLPNLLKSSDALKDAYNVSNTLKSALPSDFQYKNSISSIANQIYNINNEIKNVKLSIELKINKSKNIESKSSSKISSLAAQMGTIAGTIGGTIVGAKTAGGVGAITGAVVGSKVGSKIGKTGAKVVTKTVSAVKKLGSKVWNGIKKVGTKVVSGVKTAAKWVGKAAKSATTWVANAFKDAKNWTCKATNDTGAWISKAAKATWNWVSHAENWKRLGALVANGLLSFVKGLVSLVEAIGDLALILGAGIDTIFFGIADIISGISTGKWDWKNTKEIWSTCKTMVTYNWTNALDKELGFRQFYDQWAYEPFKSDGIGCEIAEGVGYIAGIIALTVATCGAGSAVATVGGTTAAGVSSGVAVGTAAAEVTGATLTITTSSLAAGGIAAAAGMGKNTAAAWNDGASTLAGLGYGLAKGTYEGAEMTLGYTINGLKLFKGAGALSQVGNSMSHVALDTIDGGSGGLIDPLLTMIYSPNQKNLNDIMKYVNYDEKGNKINNKTWDDLSFGEKYNAIFQYKGGWNTVATQAASAAAMSFLSEVPEIYGSIKSVKNLEVIPPKQVEKVKNIGITEQEIQLKMDKYNKLLDIKNSDEYISYMDNVEKELKQLEIELSACTIGGATLSLNDFQYSPTGILKYSEDYIKSNIQKFTYTDTNLFEGLNENIKQNGLYHFTSHGDEILDSGYIKPSNWIESYGNSKTFFFNGTPEVGSFATNLDNLPLKAEAIKVIPTDELLNSNKFKIRNLDDGAITFDGKFEFDATSASKEYFCLFKEGNELVYKKVDKAFYDIYQDTIDGKIIQEFIGNKQNINAIKQDYYSKITMNSTNAKKIGNTKSLVFDDNLNKKVLTEIEDVIIDKPKLLEMNVDDVKKSIKEEISKLDSSDLDFDSKLSLLNKKESLEIELLEKMSKMTTETDLATKSIDLLSISDQQSVKESAKRIYDNAINQEISVTKSMKRLVDSETNLEGLDFKVKSLDSIQDKLARKLYTGYSIDQAVENINDSLRYTLIVNGNYEETVLKKLGTLQYDGYKVVDLNNAWGNSTYQGLNVTLKNQDGLLVELQFHTSDSFYTKQVINHELYELSRNTSTSAEIRNISNEIQSINQKLYVGDKTQFLYNDSEMLNTAAKQAYKNEFYKISSKCKQYGFDRIEAGKNMSLFYGDAGSKITTMLRDEHKTISQILDELSYNEKLEFQNFLNNTISGKYISSLTTEELNAITRYTTEEYQLINTWLRTGNIPPNEKRYIEILNSALNKFGGVKGDTNLIRGIDVSTFTNQPKYDALFKGIDTSNINELYLALSNLEGKVFEDAAYLSTSPSYMHSFATWNSKNIVLNIIAEDGTPGAYINQLSSFYNSENEFLLAAGTELEIIDVLAPMKINNQDKIVINCKVRKNIL